MTIVTAEVGTTGSNGTVTIGTGPDADKWAVMEAVALEHPCSDSSCDIATALDEGFPFTAAYLLLGATETPLLDAVLSALKLSLTDSADVPDWNEWIEFHRANGRECVACGSFEYDADADTCGNCLALLVLDPIGDD